MIYGFVSSKDFHAKENYIWFGKRYLRELETDHTLETINSSLSALEKNNEPLTKGLQ